MAFSSRPAARDGFRHPLFALAILTTVLATFALRRPSEVPEEARINEAVARHLLDNTTVGRQGLVASFWRPPLPVLLRLPLVAWIPRSDLPRASILLGSASAAVAVLILWRFLRSTLPVGATVVLTAAAVLHPTGTRLPVTGSDTGLLICLAMGVLGGLAGWLTSRRLACLLWFATSAALLTLSSGELVLWLLLMFLLLLIDQAVSGTPRSRREAVLILGLLPSIYAGALWVLMNWLVMGDPFYFLRSLAVLPLGLRPSAMPFGVGASLVQPLAWALGLAGLAVWSRNRAAVYTALSPLSLGVVGLGLGAAGCSWSALRVAEVLFPLTVLATGPAASALYPTRRWAARAALVWPLGLALALRIMAWAEASAAATLARSSVPMGKPQTRHSAAKWIEDLRAHVRSRSRHVKVFVCGYEGVLLLEQEAGDPFLPSLDFDFEQARRDYYGQLLFVLVHRPEGISATDSIHWKYPGIYAWGHRRTLYDSDWGLWRLFEIIQAPTGGRMASDWPKEATGNAVVRSAPAASEGQAGQAAEPPGPSSEPDL